MNEDLKYVSETQRELRKTNLKINSDKMFLKIHDPIIQSYGGKSV